LDTVQQLRQQIIRQRKALTSAEIAQSSEQIATCLFDSEIFQQARNIASYLPVSGEADPTSLFANSEKTFFLPVLRKDEDGRMFFVRIDRNSQFTFNKFGIPEPVYTGADLIQEKQLDLVIMPLVSFDLYGNRIGMGGGYYDRSFAFKQRLPLHKPFLMGYAYKFQQAKTLKPESWDVQMDGLVTENGLFFY
jgi:5-formyltetrahydrofolate cyclo-ligase